MTAGETLHITLNQILNQYAFACRSRIDLGQDSARLSGLKLQKFGFGLAEALRVIRDIDINYGLGLNVEPALEANLFEATAQLVKIIDPSYGTNNSIYHDICLSPTGAFDLQES